MSSFNNTWRLKRMDFRIKRIKWGKSFLLTIVILITCISTVSFSFKFSTVDETLLKMTQLERTIQDIHAAIKIDSTRHYKIQKIITIFNQYNEKMPHIRKYEIAEEIYKMSVKYSNLDIDLICATITHESALTWNPQIVSQAGAMGLMQIMPTTGIYLCQYEGLIWTSADDILFNPIYNIRLGCRYLSSLIHAYEVDGGLAAYNGGEKRAALWVKNNRQDETILWEETRGYVPAVLKLYKQFQQDGSVL